MSIEYATYFDYTRHAPVVPPLVAGRETSLHPVVIAGGGPIGLALALGLARYGVPVIVLEADDSVCFGSRAACISRRSLEIFEQLDVATPMLAKGLAWTSGTSYYRDRPVFRLEMPMDANQKHPPMINLEQCYAEQYLIDAMAGKRIEVRWQSKLAGVEQRADGVTLAVETPAGNYTMQAQWLVACDGARSFVRSALGLRFSGTRYEGTYIIVDVLLRSSYPTERRAWFDPPSNPGSTILMHRQPDDIWRIDYQLRDDEVLEEAIRPENVLPRVRRHLEWIGERDDWQPVLISSYKANCLTLDRYDHGRVLFAGDAAHLVPIFGVRGMNSGIDDTHNLAWKLAFVVNGIAEPALLGTYSDERVHAARENIRYASKSTEFMAPPDFAFTMMREAVLGLALAHPRLATLANPRQSSAIAYGESKLNAVSSGAFAAGPRPGEILPEAPLDHGHLTDLLGPHFTVLLFGEAATPLRVDAGPIPLAVKPVPDRRGIARALYGAQEGTVYLVRPDGHVAARWLTTPAPAAIEAALRNACMPRSA